jgi:hypothetical protein
VAVADLGARSVVAGKPAPSLADIAATLQSSNAVSAGFANSKALFFIANGEGGLWVGDSESVRDAACAVHLKIRRIDWK